MALYITRPRRDEERIGRGLPSASGASGNQGKAIQPSIGGGGALGFCDVVLSTFRSLVR